MTRRRRRRPFSGRGGSSKSNWIALSQSNDFMLVPVETSPLSLPLFVPAVDGVVPITMLRLVGSIAAVPVVATGSWAEVISFMIYRAAENAGSFLPLDPFDLADVDNDDIVLWHQMYFPYSPFLFADGAPFLFPVDFKIDIKSKRIFTPNESRLVLTIAAQADFVVASNLRGLFKEAAGP